MKKTPFFTGLVYLLLSVSGSLFGIGEKTMILGGAGTWNLADIRMGVTEASSVRPHPVLMLSSRAAGTGSLDMSISFDEPAPSRYRDSAGSYGITASAEVEAVDMRYSRAGNGAALFSGTSTVPNSGPLIIEPGRSAMFAPDKRVGDFTLEFWLYPLKMENGEQVLSWISSKTPNVRTSDGRMSDVRVPVGSGSGGVYTSQRFQCDVVRNRLQWSFSNFFTAVNGASAIDINFSGSSAIVPRSWSHHQISFDAKTGMIEYMVNGVSEAIVYATSSGHEGGDVYTPLTGRGGIFIVGSRFMGIMDELKIHNACLGRVSTDRYAPPGGRIETRALDLGIGRSNILRVDAKGGKTGMSASRMSSEFRENGTFRFSDDSQLQFYIRVSNNPYNWEGSAWESFTPGREFARELKGRYVQLAVDFYPSADGESSPYLDEMRIIYRPNEAPLPPQAVIATAVDGAVMLTWRSSPDINAAGYLVYYSPVRGEYFGEESLLGASPIDAGRRNSLLIDGLRNGTLYYFRIAAYDRPDGTGSSPLIGEFSREVTARPLMGLSPQAVGIVE